MTLFTLADLADPAFDDCPLWAPGYKIPWNDPAFSRRMLREHLSQEHDLASRRTAAVARQARWLRGRFPLPAGGSVLDLGCGPGLYARHLLPPDGRYRGVDFSPASIDYARAGNQAPGAEFILGDLLEADLGGPHDLAVLLYGEFNVFPPEDAARLLRRAWESLAPGGVLFLEPQDRAAVEAVGRAPDGWNAVRSGLFGDSPHLMLTRSRWFAAEGAARQAFCVVHGHGGVEVMRSTTKAWSCEELARLLADAGFADVRPEPEWPGGGAGLAAWSARRPVG